VGEREQSKSWGGGDCGVIGSQRTSEIFMISILHTGVNKSNKFGGERYRLQALYHPFLRRIMKILNFLLSLKENSQKNKLKNISIHKLVKKGNKAFQSFFLSDRKKKCPTVGSSVKAS
jgi:hypothetical protein